MPDPVELMMLRTSIKSKGYGDLPVERL